MTRLSLEVRDIKEKNQRIDSAARSFQDRNSAPMGPFHTLKTGSLPMSFSVTIPRSDCFPNLNSKNDHSGTEDETYQNSRISSKADIPNLQNQRIESVDSQIIVTPESFSWLKKWLISILVLSIIYANGIFSSLVSALGTKIEGELTANFIGGVKGLNVPLSIFNVGNAVGPIFLAPLSERYGRAPVLRSGWMFYIIFNAGCGFATSQVQLFFLRLLAGLAAAGPICLSQLILAEMWGKPARGTPCCLNALSVVVGPAIGNVLGARAMEVLAWRWIFWGTSLISLGLQILAIIFLPETNKAKLRLAANPTLQMTNFRSSELTFVSDQKAENIDIATSQKSQLESAAGQESTASSNIPVAEGKSKTLDEYRDLAPPEYYRFVFISRSSHSVFPSKFLPLPLWIFFHDPLVFILSTQMGMIYWLFYTVQARVVSLYHHDLHESMRMSSLHVLSMALGAICASKLNTRGLSAICDSLGIVSKRSRGRPEYQFRCMIPGICLLPLGAFCFGLITQLEDPWLLTDLGLFFLGAGVIFGFRKAGSYTIDTFGDNAASALAALHLIRRIESFVVPLIINLTIKSRLGYEFIIFGACLFALVVVCPMPFLLFIYGPRIRRLPILQG
ncbi:hypothetical protein PCASD_16636 [Puccinia coronata f. sp. avenae]|uniref:Major facilitator superfamily (MFS) profile domain-containing protein n=1 Tax=Puccinia coronata f. sp. avenae TaxID=200324 RepID=A0A2N5T3N1_9BASI|nr:hypothetical protein PCASD_16636 [Puccinia coronata f. sp. avenae]